MRRALIGQTEFFPQQVLDHLPPGRVVVSVARVAENSLGVDADQRQVYPWIVLAAGQPDLAELRAEFLQGPGH